MVKFCYSVFSGAQACVLAFSTVDRDSFEAIESWKRKVLDLKIYHKNSKYWNRYL